ncbi:MAG TPA: transglycosylase SLT domain-containing protein [Bacteroidales bacterium]
MILLDKFKLNKGEKLPDVERRIQQVCTLLGIKPAWLMMVMWSESRLDAQSVNKQPGDSDNPQIRTANRATGLIQIMPDTALNLGTTTKALYFMNAIDQLGYVYKYFKPWTGKIKSYFDLYLVTFFPDAVGKPDDYILQTKKLSASTIAKQNPFFDVNKDGKLTVGEIKRRMYESIPKAIVTEVVSELEKKSLS